MDGFVCTQCSSALQTWVACKLVVCKLIQAQRLESPRRFGQRTTRCRRWGFVRNWKQASFPSYVSLAPNGSELLALLQRLINSMMAGKYGREPVLPMPTPVASAGLDSIQPPQQILQIELKVKWWKQKYKSGCVNKYSRTSPVNVNVGGLINDVNKKSNVPMSKQLSRPCYRKCGIRTGRCKLRHLDRTPWCPRIL